MEDFSFSEIIEEKQAKDAIAKAEFDRRRKESYDEFFAKAEAFFVGKKIFIRIRGDEFDEYRSVCISADGCEIWDAGGDIERIIEIERIEAAAERDDFFFVIIAKSGEKFMIKSDAFLAIVI